MFKPIHIIGIAVFFILGLFSLGFCDETMTITTYYPSPYGSYNQLQTYMLGVGDNNNNGSLDANDVPSTQGDVWIAGNVGIGNGTTTLNKKLNIYVGATNNNGIYLNDSDTSGFFINTRLSGLPNAKRLLISADGYGYINNEVTLLSDGYVGIGTESPTYQLHLSTDSAGKPNGGSWGNSSDIRVKKNIKDIDNPLELMLKLHGRQFTWINPEEHGNLKNPRFGFIAQETEEIFPEWFSETEPQGKDKALVKEGKIKSINIFGFEALTVEAIRQLKAENDALKTKNIELEARIKAIETKLNVGQ